MLSDRKPHTNWASALRQGRKDYAALQEKLLKYIKHPEALAEVNVDPLTDDPNVSLLDLTRSLFLCSNEPDSLHGTQSDKTKSSAPKSGKTSSVSRTRPTTTRTSSRK